MVFYNNLNVIEKFDDHKHVIYVEWNKDFGSIVELNKDYTSWVNFVKKNAVALASLLLFIYSIYLCKKMKHKFNGTKQLPTKVLNIEDVDCEHLTFLTTYIIPLVCIPITHFVF